MGTPLRVAAAAGFWGDRNDVLLDQLRGGPVDVVMLDYLAEVTMALLRRARAKDPRAGFATDFVRALEPALPELATRGAHVVTNAGGIHPEACAEAVVAACRRAGVRLRVGVVTGDDLMERLDALAPELSHMESGEPLARVRERVLSANAYLGAEPIAEALRRGADVVITGRCTDSALVLGPALARFGWAAGDWDRRAAGVVAGHVIECGGQASGGNFAGGWRDVPELARLGYPIAEIDEDGTVVITKHPGLGGLVNAAVVKEQLLYEIGDPRAYLTPDVTADFTSLALSDLGGDRVRLSGIRGTPPPSRLKVSITYEHGWMNVAALTFVRPDAIGRARAAAEILLARCRHLGIAIEAHRIDLVGAGAAQGPMAEPLAADPIEVMLRVAVRTREREAAERFATEVAPLLTSGVPGACRGIAPGRAPAHPVVDHWPALVARDAVEAMVKVEVMDA